MVDEPRRTILDHSSKVPGGPAMERASTSSQPLGQQPTSVSQISTIPTATLRLPQSKTLVSRSTYLVTPSSVRLLRSNTCQSNQYSILPLSLAAPASGGVPRRARFWPTGLVGARHSGSRVAGYAGTRSVVCESVLYCACTVVVYCVAFLVFLLVVGEPA